MFSTTGASKSVVVPLNTDGFLNMADSMGSNCALGKMHIQARHKRLSTGARSYICLRRAHDTLCHGHLITESQDSC